MVMCVHTHILFSSSSFISGIIKSGIACKVYKYSPQRHANFLSTMEDFDACIVRFQTSNLKVPVSAAETFLGSLAALESNGKVVYPSPAAIKAMAFGTSQTPAVKLVMVKDKVVGMEPADPKYAAVKAKFELSDMATLMESLHHLSEPPLLWSASFVPHPTNDGEFILGHYSCDCVEVSAFKAARGAIKLAAVDVALTDGRNANARYRHLLAGGLLTEASRRSIHRVTLVPAR